MQISPGDTCPKWQLEAKEHEVRFLQQQLEEEQSRSQPHEISTGEATLREEKLLLKKQLDRLRSKHVEDLTKLKAQLKASRNETGSLERYGTQCVWSRVGCGAARVIYFAFNWL